MGSSLNERLLFISNYNDYQMCCFKREMNTPDRVFPRPFTHGGSRGGQVQGDKALMGGTHEGGHRPYGEGT